MPGRLYTVAPRATRVVPRLLARNERITTVMATPFGRAALVMVGAVGVGRISTAYGALCSNIGAGPGSTSFDPPVARAKGDELGTFHLGSTVVLVMEPGPWTTAVAAGDALRMGQPLLRRV
jgi:phosphatidylserine decarboxylase